LWNLWVVVAGSAKCAVDVGSYFWDFSDLEAKQVTYVSPDQWTFTFTFCSAVTCSRISSSLCQVGPDGDENSLGFWSPSSKWSGASSEAISVKIEDGSPAWCPGAPRSTNVTFQCTDALVPSFVSLLEVAACAWEAKILVPRSVCPGYNPSCCTPATYASTRVDSGGLTSVVQADAVTGNWFDGNFQKKKESLLCIKSFNKCFLFTETTCVSSLYRPPDSQCFGTTPDWTLIRVGPLADRLPLRQAAWLSRVDGSYVVTMPLADARSCVVVSGSKVDTSFEFTLTPNVTLWSIPRSCTASK